MAKVTPIVICEWTSSVACQAVPVRQSYYLKSNIIKLSLFFVPKYNPLPFCTTLIPSPVVAKLIKSGVAARAALEFLKYKK